MEQESTGNVECREGENEKVVKGYASRSKEMKGSRLVISKCELHKTLNSKNVSKFYGAFRKKNRAFRNLKVDYNAIRDNKLPGVFKIFSNIRQLQTVEIAFR